MTFILIFLLSRATC